MQHATSRTLLVATSSAGLILGGALSAGASGRDGHDGGHDQSWGKGWVRVCQTVKDNRWDPYNGGGYDGHGNNGGGYNNDHNSGGYNKDHSNGYSDPNAKIDNRYRYGDNNGHGNGDRNRYEASYLVRDSRGNTYWVKLKGKQDCETVKVNKGWAKVTVIKLPDNARLTSDRSVWVKVRKFDTAEADFTYRANRHNDHHDHSGHNDYSSQR